MSHNSRFRNVRSATYYPIVISVLIGIVSLIICLVVFSFLMSKLNIPEGIVKLLSTAGLCIGAYSGGYFASRKKRKNGIFIGFLTGIMFYALILIIGLIFASASLSFSTLLKVLIVAICGAIGGVIGVNSRHKRY